MKKKFKILMLGKPGGTLVRTFDWHVEALNNDQHGRFHVDDLTSVKGDVNISKYDIFWFYSKSFHPNLYNQVKTLCPNAKIICGPNVLLDKPDIGPADDWDQWYVNFCKPDIHLDQVQFYSEHVKKFLSPDMKNKARTLDKCMKIDDSFYKPDEVKIYDCLLYSKKRRYDINFESFRNQLISHLVDNQITFYEIKAGKFGSYKREDYFSALNKSKITVNLSLDECPGILNYESMFFNVPVVGSPNNVPINSSDIFYVYDTDYMTESYLARKEDASMKYFRKIKEVLSGDLGNLKSRNFIIDHTSFERYCDKVYELLEE